MQNKNQDMYRWLEDSIGKYYQFIRALKRKEDGDILLYRNKNTSNYVVVRNLQGYYPAYERLVNIKQNSLTIVYEYAYNGMNSIIAEEYIDGMPISFLLEQRLFSETEVQRIVLRVCEGLITLHENQIVYRDIKPDNIMIMGDGAVKLIDFDISKIYKQQGEKDTTVLGTVGYAAPEQYGEAQSDKRTDIYAVGVLMNVMLTGEHPSKQIARGKMGAIIEKCIMVVPEKRYGSVKELKEKLEKLIY